MHKSKKAHDTNNAIEVWIKVQRIEISINAGMNINLTIDTPLFHVEDDPAFEFETHLDVTGECYSPKIFEEYKLLLSIMGDGGQSGHIAARIKDFHEMDENLCPIYKNRRGNSYPVYKSPLGLSTVRKRRGENVLEAYLWVRPNMVSDILSLYALNGPLFGSVSIKKHGRDKWIERLSIQTSCPSNE